MNKAQVKFRIDSFSGEGKDDEYSKKASAQIIVNEMTDWIKTGRHDRIVISLKRKDRSSKVAITTENPSGYLDINPIRDFHVSIKYVRKFG